MLFTFCNDVRLANITFWFTSEPTNIRSNTEEIYDFFNDHLKSGNITNEEYVENYPVDSTLQNPDNQTTSLLIIQSPSQSLSAINSSQMSNQEAFHREQENGMIGPWSYMRNDQNNVWSFAINYLVNYETSIKWSITKYSSSDFYLPQIHECTTTAIATTMGRNTLS